MIARVLFPTARKIFHREEGGMRFSITIMLAAVLVSSGVAQTSRSSRSKKTSSSGGGRFVPGCHMPFDSKKTAFDSKCSIKGAGTAADKIAESKAKNNFCGNTDSPVRLSSDD